MINDQTFKENDILIEFGTAYKVFKVKRQKNLEDKIEPFIFYKPYFKTQQNQTIICSIPVSSFSKTNKRKPLSKKDIVQLLEVLTQPPTLKEPVNTAGAREILGSNDAFKIVKLVKRLWLEKEDPYKKFSRSKNNIYQKALKHLTQEVAVVLDLTPEKAKQKILAKLRDGELPLSNT